MMGFSDEKKVEYLKDVLMTVVEYPGFENLSAQEAAEVSRFATDLYFTGTERTLEGFTTETLMEELRLRNKESAIFEFDETATDRHLTYVIDGVKVDVDLQDTDYGFFKVSEHAIGKNMF